MTWHECEKAERALSAPERGLREIEEAVAGGEKRICVTSPTVAARVACSSERAKKRGREGKKIGIVTHRRPLISQTSRNLEKQVWPTDDGQRLQDRLPAGIQVISVWRSPPG
jgi:hypothetical protein